MILYLDLVSGIAGDMALGALVDLGVSTDWLQEKLSRVLQGFTLRTETVFPHHLRAVSLHVDVSDQTTSRNYVDIRKMIETADLPEPVRVNSLAAFRKIAAAESRIHGKDINTVHFHEIGGIDSLVDIIGTFLAVDHLGITRVAASHVPLGSGFIDCAHGKIPVPVPATLAILNGIPVRQSDATTEIVTPTGAAIVATLAQNFGPMPQMEIVGTGYGAGKRETGSAAPNILRAVLGTQTAREAQNPHILRDRVMVMKTNVDDMNPEITGFLMDRLFAAGALDVAFVPVAMKKNRPATCIEVICREDDLEDLAELILTQTTAIGLRYHACDRMMLKRESVVLDLPAASGLGSIRAKAVTDPDGKTRIIPEYEACRAKAAELELPLQEVYHRVIAAVNPLDREGGRLYKTRSYTEGSPS